MAEARTGAGRPQQEPAGEEERRVIRPSRIQNEHPGGISQEEGLKWQSVGNPLESQTTWEYSHLVGSVVISN